MVVPLIAASMAPQIAEMVKTLKPQGNDNVFADFIYQPMRTIGKKKEKREVPDKRYPKGIHYSIPAWMATAAFIIGIWTGLGMAAVLSYIVIQIPTVRHNETIKPILAKLKL